MVSHTGWFYVAVLLSPALVSGGCVGDTPTKQLICGHSGHQTLPTDFDPCLCTHLVFDKLDKDEVETALSYREKNPQLKLVGRLRAQGSDLKESADQQEYWTKRLVRDSHLNGVLVDVQWTHKEDAPPAKSKLLQLVKALATELDDVRSSKRANKKYERSESTQSDDNEGTGVLLVLPNQPHLLGKNYDLKKLSKYVDYFMLATENITDASEDGLTYHHSRLMGIDDILNADSLVDLVTGLGAEHEKLVITLPAGVSQFLLTDPEKNMPRSPASRSPTAISQSQLCKMIGEGGWTVERDEDLTAPYAYRGKIWTAFDDPTSAAIKGKYILLRDLGGAAVDSIQLEDWTGACGNSSMGKARLITTLHETFTNIARKPRAAQLVALQEQLHQASHLPFAADVQLSPYRIVRVVDRAGSIHVVRKEAKTEFKCSRQGYFTHPSGCNRFYRCVKFNQYSEDYTVFEYDCPAGLAFDERYEVCVWPGSLPDSAACHGSSEIAPVPRSRFSCPQVEGYYADPENCRWFFACLDHRRDGSYLTAYEFRCPFGLVFNEKELVCDWPWRVQSCGSGAALFGVHGVGHLTPGDILEGRLRPSYAKVSDVHVSGGRIENVNGGLVLGSSLLSGVQGGAELRGGGDEYLDLGLYEGTGLRTGGSGIRGGFGAVGTDNSGQYIEDSSGQYIHDNSGEYVQEDKSGAGIGSTVHGSGGAGGYVHDSRGDQGGQYVPGLYPSGGGSGAYVHDGRGEHGTAYVSGGHGIGSGTSAASLEGQLLRGSAGLASNDLSSSTLHGKHVDSSGGAYLVGQGIGGSLESGGYVHDARGDHGGGYIAGVYSGSDAATGNGLYGGKVLLNSGSYLQGVKDNQNGGAYLASGAGVNLGSGGLGGSSSTFHGKQTGEYVGEGQYVHDARGDHGGDYVAGLAGVGAGSGSVSGSTFHGKQIESGSYLSGGDGQYVHDNSGDYVHDGRGDHGTTGGAYVAGNYASGVGVGHRQGATLLTAGGSSSQFHGKQIGLGTHESGSGGQYVHESIGSGLGVAPGASLFGTGATIHGKQTGSGVYVSNAQGQYVSENSGAYVHDARGDHGTSGGAYVHDARGDHGTSGGAYVLGQYASGFGAVGSPGVLRYESVLHGRPGAGLATGSGGLYLHDNSGAYVHDTNGYLAGQYASGAGSAYTSGVSSSSFHGKQIGSGAYVSGNEGKYVHDNRGGYIHGVVGGQGTSGGAYVAGQYAGGIGVGGQVLSSGGLTNTLHSKQAASGVYLGGVGGQYVHDNSGEYVHDFRGDQGGYSGGQYLVGLGQGVKTSIHGSTPRPLVYYQPSPSVTPVPSVSNGGQINAGIGLVRPLSGVHVTTAAPATVVKTSGLSVTTPATTLVHDVLHSAVVPSSPSFVKTHHAVFPTGGAAYSHHSNLDISAPSGPALAVSPAVVHNVQPAVHNFQKVVRPFVPQSIEPVRAAVTPTPLVSVSSATPVPSFNAVEFGLKAETPLEPIIHGYGPVPLSHEITGYTYERPAIKFELPQRPLLTGSKRPVFPAVQPISVTSSPPLSLEPIQHVQSHVQPVVSTVVPPIVPQGQSFVSYSQHKPIVPLETISVSTPATPVVNYGFKSPTIAPITVTSSPVVPLKPVQYIQKHVQPVFSAVHAPVVPQGQSFVSYSQHKPIVPLETISVSTPATPVGNYGFKSPTIAPITVTSSPVVPLKPVQYIQKHVQPVFSTVHPPVVPQGHSFVSYSQRKPIVPLDTISVSTPSPPVVNYGFKSPTIAPITVTSSPVVPLKPVQYIQEHVQPVFSTVHPPVVPQGQSFVSYSQHKSIVPLNTISVSTPAPHVVNYGFKSPTIAPITVTSSPVVPLKPVQYIQKHVQPVFSTVHAPVVPQGQSFVSYSQHKPIIPLDTISVSTPAPHVVDYGFKSPTIAPITVTSSPVVPLKPVQYIQKHIQPVFSTVLPPVAPQGQSFVSYSQHKPIVPLETISVSTPAPPVVNYGFKSPTIAPITVTSSPVVPLKPVQYIQKHVQPVFSTVHPPVVPQGQSFVSYSQHKPIVPLDTISVSTPAPHVVDYGFKSPTIAPITVTSSPVVPLKPVQYIQKHVQPVFSTVLPPVVPQGQSFVRYSQHKPIVPLETISVSTPAPPVVNYGFKSPTIAPITVTSAPAVPLQPVQYLQKHLQPIVSTTAAPSVVSYAQPVHHVPVSTPSPPIEYRAPTIQPISVTSAPVVPLKHVQYIQKHVTPIVSTTFAPAVDVSHHGFSTLSEAPSPFVSAIHKQLRPVVSTTVAPPSVTYFQKPVVSVAGVFHEHTNPLRQVPLDGSSLNYGVRTPIAVTSSPIVPLNPVQYVQKQVQPIVVSTPAPTVVSTTPSSPIVFSYSYQRPTSKAPVPTTPHYVRPSNIGVPPPSFGPSYGKPITHNIVGYSYQEPVQPIVVSSPAPARQPSIPLVSTTPAPSIVGYSYNNPIVPAQHLDVSTPAPPVVFKETLHQRPLSLSTPAPSIVGYSYQKEVEHLQPLDVNSFGFSFRKPVAPVHSFKFTTPAPTFFDLALSKTPVPVAPLTVSTPAPAFVDHTYRKTVQPLQVTTPAPSIVGFSYNRPVRPVVVSTPAPAVVDYTYRKTVQPLHVTTPAPSIVGFSYNRPVRPVVVSTPAPPVVDYTYRTTSQPVHDIATGTGTPAIVGFSYQRPVVHEQPSIVSYSQPEVNFHASAGDVDHRPIVTSTTPSPIAVSTTPVVPLEPINYLKKVAYERPQVIDKIVSSRPIVDFSYEHRPSVESQVRDQFPSGPVETYEGPSLVVDNAYKYQAVKDALFGKVDTSNYAAGVRTHFPAVTTVRPSPDVHLEDSLKYQAVKSAISSNKFNTRVETHYPDVYTVTTARPVPVPVPVPVQPETIFEENFEANRNAAAINAGLSIGSLTAQNHLSETSGFGNDLTVHTTATPLVTVDELSFGLKTGGEIPSSTASPVRKIIYKKPVQTYLAAGEESLNLNVPQIVTSTAVYPELSTVQPFVKRVRVQGPGSGGYVVRKQKVRVRPVTTENYPQFYTTSTLKPLFQHSTTLDLVSPTFYSTTVRPLVTSTSAPEELEIAEQEEEGQRLLQELSGGYGDIVVNAGEEGIVSHGGSTTVSSLKDGEAIVGVIRKEKYNGKKARVVVVSRLSDFNPILVGKLGAECSCKSRSNTLSVKTPPEPSRAYLPVVSTTTVAPQQVSLQVDDSPSVVVGSTVRAPTVGNTGIFASVDCQRAGLFRHPKYCNKFYSCNWDPWKKRFTLHVFNCPIHLAYDSNLGACNWPSKGPACADDNLLV